MKPLRLCTTQGLRLAQPAYLARHILTGLLIAFIGTVGPLPAQPASAPGYSRGLGTQSSASDSNPSPTQPPADLRQQFRLWLEGPEPSPGPIACTAETAAACAELALDPDARLARRAVEKLIGWGAAASNAVPQLLRGLKARRLAGGHEFIAGLEWPRSWDYARALAQVGPDLKEVLVELLASRRIVLNPQGVLHRWCDNSRKWRSLLLEVVLDPNETVRLSAAVTLAWLPAYRTQVVRHLLAAISSPALSSALRLHAVQQLEQRLLRPGEFPEAIGVLTAALNDADPKVQQSAARVLANIEPRPKN